MRAASGLTRMCGCGDDFPHHQPISRLAPVRRVRRGTGHAVHGRRRPASRRGLRRACVLRRRPLRSLSGDEERRPTEEGPAQAEPRGCQRVSIQTPATASAEDAMHALRRRGAAQRKKAGGRCCLLLREGVPARLRPRLPCCRRQGQGASEGAVCLLRRRACAWTWRGDGRGMCVDGVQAQGEVREAEGASGGTADEATADLDVHPLRRGVRVHHVDGALLHADVSLQTHDDVSAGHTTSG